MTASTGVATVLGNQGFIGTALYNRLTKAGWKCLVPDRHHSWPADDQNLGHIFYCIGRTANYSENPEKTVQAHISLLTDVLMSRNYDSLTYLSSTRLYDMLPSSIVATEELSIPVHPGNPRHFYDISKLAGEAICAALGKGKARVARLACVYRDHTDPHGFLGELLNLIKNSPNPDLTASVPSSPAMERDYVYLEDVLDALIMIATQGKAPIYNVASGINVRNSDISRLIHETTGIRLDMTSTAYVPCPPPSISNTLLCHELGWKPRQLPEQLGCWAKAHFQNPNS